MLYHEVGLRNLALVHIQYDKFNSISPASFLRVGSSLLSKSLERHSWRARRKYSPHEYLTLVIHSTIAQGATGVLHEAELILDAKDGTTLRGKVIVKFAFSAEQQDRMQHEYSVYDHMVSAGIKGVIADVLGLFKDMEGGPMALIMSHAGSSLWDRRPSTKDIRVKASSTERWVLIACGVLSNIDYRAAFLRAMQTIHDAGIRHNDLSPGNLLVNDEGQVTIIDFDRATLMSSKGARRRELARLTETLDGFYVPREFVSDPTTGTSGSRSGSTGVTPPSTGLDKPAEL
jgi:serine/threonine protein kinase